MHIKLYKIEKKKRKKKKLKFGTKKKIKNQHQLRVDRRKKREEA